MQKREIILLSVLGVVVVVAIIVFVVSGMDSTLNSEQDAKDDTVSAGESAVKSLDSASSLLNGDKFLMLTTFGKVPVVVEPAEIGKSNPFSS